MADETNRRIGRQGPRSPLRQPEAEAEEARIAPPPMRGGRRRPLQAREPAVGEVDEDVAAPSSADDGLVGRRLRERAVSAAPAVDDYGDDEVVRRGAVRRRSSGGAAAGGWESPRSLRERGAAPRPRRTAEDVAAQEETAEAGLLPYEPVPSAHSGMVEFNYKRHGSQVGLIDGYDPADPMAPIAVRSRAMIEPDDKLNIGPLKKIYLIWMVGASCDGCTVAVTGATHPRVEHLLAGIVPGLPRVELVHTVVSTEVGPEWVHNLFMADRGELDAPYVIAWEGSIMDESISGEGFWMGLGEDPDTGRQITSLEWLDRLAPNAAAIVAVGTCASWGGIPAAKGNVTNAMGVMDYLGKDYRSAFGVPVVNVPGCSPIGDNVIETASAVLLFLNGLAPLPEFDELGRPAWLFGETVHRHCPRAGYYEEGVFAEKYGDKECLVELGCWGPVVQCNIAERGIVDGHGGCMNMGGICIGCTMPGFPDKFSPIYQTPPGSLLSSNTCRITGGAIRRMRYVSRIDKNLSPRWDDEVPSGWARSRTTPKGATKIIHKFYARYQHSHEGG